MNTPKEQLEISLQSFDEQFAYFHEHFAKEAPIKALQSVHVMARNWFEVQAKEIYAAGKTAGRNSAIDYIEANYIPWRKGEAPNLDFVMEKARKDTKE